MDDLVFQFGPVFAKFGKLSNIGDKNVGLGFHMHGGKWDMFLPYNWFKLYGYQKKMGNEGWNGVMLLGSWHHF